MRTLRFVALAGALAGLAACAGGSTQQRAEEGQVQAPEALTDVQRLASGSQPGVIRDITDQLLLLDPFEETAGITELALPRQVPIFRDGKFLSMDVRGVLQAGEPVNVYFGQREGEEGTAVIGVEILSEREAEQLRRAVGGAGSKM